MTNNHSLERFITAQQPVYHHALTEIQHGRKQSHWMWFIFPQLKGLGISQTSEFYGLANLSEANDYLNHPVLGTRLLEITAAALTWPEKSARDIFGAPDHLKFHSCMTLFGQLTDSPPVFGKAIDQFFAGKQDTCTLALLGLRDRF